MARLINADVLFEKVGNIKPTNETEYELLGKFMNMITNSPTVEQRSHGEWIIVDDCEHFVAKCSVCGRIEDSRLVKNYPFCRCGADMRKEGVPSD